MNTNKEEMEAFHDKVDEMFLTVTNEAKFYVKLPKLLQGIALGGLREWQDFRLAVYGAAIKAHPEEQFKYGSEAEQTLYRRRRMSWLAYKLFEHYTLPDYAESFCIQTPPNVWEYVTRGVADWWREDLEWVKAETAKAKQTEASSVTVFYDATQDKYVQIAQEYFNQFSNQLEEIQMSVDATVAVLKKTYIFGKDADQVTVDDVFTHIANLEAEAAKYDGIKNKPKAIEAKVAEINAQIAELVAFSDAHFSK